MLDAMDDAIELIDDLLPLEQLQLIQDTFSGNGFPWFRSDGVNDRGDGHLQFIHIFYRNKTNNSSYMDLINPILELIDPAAVVRIKANLLPRADSIIKHGFHTDQDFKCRVGIFYVNTNDGFTEFADGTKIASVANRFVSFGSHLLHTGTTCTDANDRMVINFTYFAKEPHDPGSDH